MTLGLLVYEQINQWRSKALRDTGSTVTLGSSLSLPSTSLSLPPFPHLPQPSPSPVAKPPPNPATGSGGAL